MAELVSDYSRYETTGNAPAPQATFDSYHASQHGDPTWDDKMSG